jgi:hypothetical protein
MLRRNRRSARIAPAGAVGAAADMRNDYFLEGFELSR